MKFTKQAAETGHHFHFVLNKINQALFIEYCKNFEQTEQLR